MKKGLAAGLRNIDIIGLWLAMLSLRILLGWDFFESGLEKFHGENWFMDIQDKFPFPFRVIASEISWQMATWFELLGGIALLIGLGTRFFSVSLFILTLVAITSVHWPESWSNFTQLMQGYGFTDKGFGNFKLPVLFLGMLLPLALLGPGRLSIDHWLRLRYLPESLVGSEEPIQINNISFANSPLNNWDKEKSLQK